MDETTTYRFSEEAVKQDKQRTLLLLVLFPFLVAIFMFAIPMPGPVSAKIVIFVFAVLLIEVSLFISYAVTLKRVHEMTLTLSSEGLERTGGKFTEKVAYQDISRIDISQNPAEQITRIKIRTTSGQVIYLYGLENIQLIIQQLEDRISDKSRVHIKRQAIDWNNPLLFIVIIIGTSIVALWIYGRGQYASQVFNAFLSFTLAVTFLVFKPLTRRGGARFKNIETIMGVVFLIYAVITAIQWISASSK